MVFLYSFLLWKYLGQDWFFPLCLVTCIFKKWNSPQINFYLSLNSGKFTTYIWGQSLSVFSEYGMTSDLSDSGHPLFMKSFSIIFECFFCSICSNTYKLDTFCFPYIYLIFFLILNSVLFYSILLAISNLSSMSIFFFMIAKKYTSTKWFLMVTWDCTVYMLDNFISIPIRYLDCLKFFTVTNIHMSLTGVMLHHKISKLVLIPTKEAQCQKALNHACESTCLSFHLMQSGS